MDFRPVFDLLVKHTIEIVPDLADHSFTATDSLRDLGANSIDRSEILMMTLESLSLRMPLVKLAHARNMGELAESISQEQLARA